MKIKINKNKKLNTTMSKKNKKILKQINEGTIISIQNMDITLEEFLSKDENDITFLEHLLRNNIFVNADCIKNSIEAAYIYCKCNEDLNIFSLDEADLFSYNNGTRFIDYLAQNNKLTPSIVKSIKNHIEIIDILKENQILYLISNINNEIANKLITLNSNGKYPIEKYLNNDAISVNIIPLIDKPKEIITVCEKNNKYNLLEYVNQNVLMYELKENYTLLDDLLSKNIIPICLQTIPNDKKFINYLNEKKLYNYLVNCSEESFLIKLENGKMVLEEVIENLTVDKIHIYITRKEFIKILYNKNKLDLIDNISESLLTTGVKDIFDIESNKTLLDYMLDNGYNFILQKIIWDVVDNWNVIKLLYDRGEYQLLFEKLDDLDLLICIENGVCLIDQLLEHDIKSGDKFISSPELIEKFFENGRYDLLATADLELLFELAIGENTYFDYLLEAIKSKQVKCDLDEFCLFGYDVNVVASFYLALAKHDMIRYVSELKKEDLLGEYYASLEEDGKTTLLDELLQLDSDLTLQKIIPKKVKSEMEIAIILKSRGLDQKNVDVSVNNYNFTNDYLTKINSRLGIGPVQEEGEYLLRKLEDLFLHDGKSDPKLISALIAGYKHALILNYNVYVNELRNLVEVKEKNINRFVYLKDEKDAYFKPSTGEVFVNDNVVDTLLHETGHALHSYLVNEKIPYECEYAIERVRKNPEVLKKVEQFAKQYTEIKKEINKLVEVESEKFFNSYFTSDKIKEIEEFLTKSQIEKKEEFKSLDVSEDILDIILMESFTLDQFINHQKRIYKEEQNDAIFRSEYGSFMAIADILDAIYEGELNSGYLKNENGDKIPRIAGHGISYYYDDPSSAFLEMIANFSSICKSPQAYEMLKLLKSIIGDELYDMLSIFYYTNIVKLDEEQVYSSKRL